MKPNHALVVAAYGESPYLEGCLESLASQTHKSPIIISTSTPFPGLDALAKRHKARLYVHGPNRGIGGDWNAALGAADSDLVTIAHQDDIYRPNFSEAKVAAHVESPDVVFSFCDCGEIGAHGAKTGTSLNHRVKRLLMATSCVGTSEIAGGWRRRLLFGFGNPIICSSVTINRVLAPDFAFREDLRTNMDWLAWIELSQRRPIRRIRQTLMDRRVHGSSETSHCISDGARMHEDRMVFDTLWSHPISAALAVAYRLSYPGYSN